jgi:hypothetical protein
MTRFAESALLQTPCSEGRHYACGYAECSCSCHKGKASEPYTPKAPKPSWTKRHPVLFAFIALFLFFALFDLISTSRQQNSASTTPARLAGANKTSEDDKPGHLTDAAHALRLLRAATRSPETFKVEHVYRMADGAFCYEFRGQNGFGGMTRGTAVSLAGLLLYERDPDFRRVYQKECADGTVVEDVKGIAWLALD